MTGNLSGYCKCGCGEKPGVYKRTRHYLGYIKGSVKNYINGHCLGKGPDSVNWKGGRRTSSEGYISIMTPDHPNANGKGYVYEHRLIAEKALGKYLPIKAVVHHHNAHSLVVCENQTYHQLLHQRTRALKACGNASWRKCWICKGWDRTENLRTRGNKVVHSQCRKDYDRKLKDNRRPLGTTKDLLLHMADESVFLAGQLFPKLPPPFLGGGLLHCENILEIIDISCF